MRSRRDDLPVGRAVERALELGLCGFGGLLDPPPADLDDALAATALTYDVRTARRLRRFAEVPDGAFVWTRELDGLYRLGRLTGPWYYDTTAPAAAVDLVQVRKCMWSPTLFPEAPSGTTHAFGRGGRNFQRIADLEVELETERLWIGDQSAEATKR
jgi:hypothetical protein